MKVFVDWYERRIYGPAEVEEKKQEIYNDNMSGDDCWNDWLNDNYSADEIFDLTDEEKREAEVNFRMEMESDANDEVDRFLSNLMCYDIEGE